MGKNTAVEAPPKEKPTARIRIPQDSKVQIKGFETCVVGEDLVLTLRGKLIEMRLKEALESQDMWDSGRTLEVEITACKFAGPKKEISSMDEAIEASETRL